MQPTPVKDTHGFTLVEVLVISPIVILFIGAFIALIVTLTGESIQIREKNASAYDMQSTFDEIESNVLRTTGFVADTGLIATPQGRNNATAAFTNTADDTLILKSAATTGSPLDANRSLIYTGTGACDSRNPTYEYLSVYFLALDPDTTTNTTDQALYRRTILPQVAACASAWQRGSCAESVVSSNTSVCKTSDEKLLGSVASFNVDYFSGTTPVTNANAATANSISITINSSKQVSGSPVSYTSSITVTSQNVITADSTPPTPAPGPSITWSRNNTGPNPYQTVFSWQPAGNATEYIVRYAYNGGAPQEQSVGLSATPSFPLNLGARKNFIDYFEVKVVTNSGTFSYGTPPSLPPNIPSWNECNFQNGWNNYGTVNPSTTFTTAGFTKTSSKLIGLKGLVAGGTMGQTICTLPVGFRPKFANEKLIFQTATSASNTGRVDILPTGEIVAVSGSNGWVSLDGIIFVADDSTYSWTVPAGGTAGWQNGWQNYNAMYGGNSHSTLRTTTDSQGRRHVQGLGGYTGTAPNSQVMTNIGAGTGPNATLHYPAQSGGPGIVQVFNNGNISTRSTPNSYQQLQLIYRNGSATGWQTMPFTSAPNEWGNYDSANWPAMRCHKGPDDVVVVQGLIAHNAASDGNNKYIGSLPTGCGRFSSGKPQGIGYEDELILSPWLSNETPGRVDFIRGQDLYSVATQDSWTSLDGIHFIAD